MSVFHPEDAVFDEFPYSLHDGVEGRREADAYDGGKEHAGERRDADGLAAAGAGAGRDDERPDAEEEGPGGHKHGAVTHVGAVDGGIKDGNAKFAFLLREFHHQNGVLAGQADKHDQA